MSFIWAEARREVRDHSLKDFPSTTWVRNLYRVDSAMQDKDRKSWQHWLAGVPWSQSSTLEPLSSCREPSGPKFTPALPGSEADMWSPVIIPLWREDTLPLTSLDTALWILLQCCKAYCSGLGRHLFPSDLWTLLASERAISTHCSLSYKGFK